jgi:hypothetical protein
MHRSKLKDKNHFKKSRKRNQSTNNNHLLMSMNCCTMNNLFQNRKNSLNRTETLNMISVIRIKVF